jgi:hypothetical protein
VHNSKPVRIIVVAVAALALAGCGTSGLAGQGTFAGPSRTGAAPTAEPTAGPSTGPATGPVLVLGRGLDGGGRPVAGILVGFRPAAATTGLVTARTGTDGTYQLTLAGGEYVVACAVTGGTCRPALSRVELTGARTTIDLVASATAPPPNPTSDPAPAPAPDDGGGGGSTISGRVLTTDGRPVAGITVEFKIVPTYGTQKQPFTQTDSAGRYAINLDDGVYNALCVTESGTCGPKGGDGGPFPVDVPPAGQHLDFLLCSLADYPRCLGG